MASHSSRGRPPAASREMLQEAAFELFLEQGYAGTTVEHITRRAGVSRNTFFNYFDAKGDVFWVELDAALAGLGDALDSAATSGDPLDTLRTVVLSIGDSFGPATVPFALTQHELIGSTTDLQASAVTRFMTAVRLLRGHLLSRSVSDARSRVIAYATVGAAIAAAQSWAAAGSGRGMLRGYLEEAVVPVLSGFTAADSHASP